MHRNRSTELQARQQQLTSCLVFDQTPREAVYIPFFRLALRASDCTAPLLRAAVLCLKPWAFLCPPRVDANEVLPACAVHKTSARAVRKTASRKVQPAPKKTYCTWYKEIAPASKKIGPLGLGGCIERGPVFGARFQPPPTCTQEAKGATFGPKFWGHFFCGLGGPAPGRQLASNTPLVLEEAQRA